MFIEAEVLISITLMVGDVGMWFYFWEFECCSPSKHGSIDGACPEQNYSANTRLSFIFHRRDPDRTERILKHIKTGGDEQTVFTNSRY